MALSSDVSTTVDVSTFRQRRTIDVFKRENDSVAKSSPNRGRASSYPFAIAVRYCFASCRAHLMADSVLGHVNLDERLNATTSGVLWPLRPPEL